MKEIEEKKIVIVDIDGTLADVSHRLYFINKPHPDWEGFLSQCPWDKPISSIIELVRSLYDHYCIILCSGRMEKSRNDTINWLERHSVPFHHLWLRGDEDYRSDVEVKRDYLEKLEKENILAVLEDRGKVVDMWRREKIICLQCKEGEY